MNFKLIIKLFKKNSEKNGDPHKVLDGRAVRVLYSGAPNLLCLIIINFWEKERERE